MIMLHRPLFLLVCVTALLLGSFLKAEQEADYFPLTKGNYWIYQGETKFLVNNPVSKQNEPKTEVLTIKMEVVDTAEGGNYFAALIKGMPSDLAWYEPGKPRGDYLILRVGSATYYKYTGERALKAWQALQENDLEKLETPEMYRESLIDAPLMVGKVYDGDFLNRVRGTRYCMDVESVAPFDTKPYPNASGLKNPVVFLCAYRTSPDHSIISFVPGLGITGYVYKHHGTLAETDLKLIEFGTAKPSK